MIRACSVLPISFRIAPRKVQGNSLTHDVVQRDAFCGGVGKGERLELIQRDSCVGNVEHDPQELFRDASNRRRRLDRLHRVTRQPRQERRRELLEHLRRWALGQVEVRLLPDGGGREFQRERVAPRESVDPRDLMLAQAPRCQESCCVTFGELVELDLMEETVPSRCGEPGGVRGLATGDDREHIFGQRGDEFLAQPRVHQPEGLVGVEHEDAAHVAFTEVLDDRFQAASDGSTDHSRQSRKRETPPSSV